jgi:hypothetical protein
MNIAPAHQGTAPRSLAKTGDTSLRRRRNGRLRLPANVPWSVRQGDCAAERGISAAEGGEA